MITASSQAQVDLLAFDLYPGVDGPGRHAFWLGHGSARADACPPLLPTRPNLEGRNIERKMAGEGEWGGGVDQRNRPPHSNLFISHHLNLIMCHDTFPAVAVSQLWIMTFLTELICVLLSSPFLHYYVLFPLTAKKQGVAMINDFRRCRFIIGSLKFITHP